MNHKRIKLWYNGSNKRNAVRRIASSLRIGGSGVNQNESEKRHTYETDIMERERAQSLSEKRV